MRKVGIVGAGQLGLMLGESAAAIDAECRFLDPADDPPAARVGSVMQCPFDDPDALSELAAWADVMTYEFENVPVAAVEAIAETVPVYPPPAALNNAQDRLHEKSLFQALEIPTSPFRNVESAEDVAAAVDALGLPLVFKTRRLGYDGKGQAVVRDADQVDAVWTNLGEVPLIAEQFVDFDREVSIIGSRSVSGEIVNWPLTENRHAGGILRVSLAPFDDDALFAMATRYHRRMLEHLDYVGTLALELFVTGDELVANEFAPRVHNSGHWTIEGADTSQFENHIRAVLDLPLGDTRPRGHAIMVNLIGSMPQGLDAATASGYTVHDYGKSPRPGRKLAHVTAVAVSESERKVASDDLLALIAVR
ncbi:MAG: 5-(carboxyamino)imidazole ribonucleotide synthase [Pseudomonadota bacterium]